MQTSWEENLIYDRFWIEEALIEPRGVHVVGEKNVHLSLYYSLAAEDLRIC